MANHYISATDAGIEWELLPSLRSGVFSRWRRADPPRSWAGTWADTMPSEFDRPCPSEPFREVVPGLAVREVAEPDIFRIFFAQPNR